MIETSALWWKNITGPVTLLNETIKRIKGGSSIFLIRPDHIPWENVMRNTIDELIHDEYDEVSVDFIDASNCRGSVSSYLFSEYADPSLKLKFRSSLKMSVQDYIIRNQVLRNRVLLINNLDDGNCDLWIDFCRGYNSKSIETGLFILEVPERYFSKNKFGSAKDQLKYCDYISYYDYVLFNNLLSSSLVLSDNWKQYISVMCAAVFVDYIEDASVLLLSHDFRKDLLNNALHDFAVERGISDDELNSRMWKAQLQVLFPLLEEERRGFINSHYQEVMTAISSTYIDQYGHTCELLQFGYKIEDPYDTEIGTLYRLVHLQKSYSDPLHLLQIDKASERDRLDLIYRMRNNLAHQTVCDSENVSMFIDFFPFFF